MKINISKKQSGMRISYLLMSALLGLSGIDAIATEKSKKESASIAHTSVVVTDLSSLFSIKVCHEDICRTITSPRDMLESIDDGYSKITTEDLTLDGLPEIILTHAQEGGVNACSKVYRYDSNQNTFIIMDNFHNQLCNHKIKNGHLISSYRSGAVWHEDIYKIENNDLILKITDSCIECGYIKRTIFYPDRKTDYLLVTDNPDYTLRTPLLTDIKSPKAMLYKEPSTNLVTEMYLIKGDEVTLTDFAYSEDDAFWYKIRYITQKGNTIEAWLKCEEIEFCD